jgi:hypothetical protein
LIGIIGMYLSNLTFGVYYELKLKNADSAFVHWAEPYSKIINYLIIVATLFNFKMLRAYYS